MALGQSRGLWVNPSCGREEAAFFAVLAGAGQETRDTDGRWGGGKRGTRGCQFRRASGGGLTGAGAEQEWRHRAIGGQEG